MGRIGYRTQGFLTGINFGSVKGRSAMEAALRTFTRAQRCLAREGAVGWAFWDVKGGFQNVREEDVIKELEKIGGRQEMDC